jgi:hypothetical protein
LKEDDENTHLLPKCYLLPLAPSCTRINREHEQNFLRKQQSKIMNKIANNTNRSVKKSKIMNMSVNMNANINKITNMNVNRNVIIKKM